jgi:hypothetical protein
MLLLSQFIFANDSITFSEKEGYAILFVVIFLILVGIVLIEIFYSALASVITTRNSTNQTTDLQVISNPQETPANTSHF